MNLQLTRDLLAAVEEQGQTPLRITESEAAREVELLASAGYVEASLETVEGTQTAVIDRLTNSGKKLLHVLSSQVSSRR